MNFSYMFSSPDMAAMHQDISEDREIVNKKLKDVFGVSICIFNFKFMIFFFIFCLHLHLNLNASY